MSQHYLLKNKLSVCLFFTIMLFGFTTKAQKGSIKGHVAANDGQPAADVSITIKGLKKGSVTNDNGNYSLNNLSEGTYTIVMMFLGEPSQEKSTTVKAGEISNLDFTLSKSSTQLAEVVVTGAKSVNETTVKIGRIDIKPMDLPQSVAIIGSKVIAEQQANKLSDVIKNVNGVTLTDTRGTNAETFFARGYNLGANNIMKNGTRANSGMIPEASTLERVEVLKGSAALLFGNVSGGAVINMITKQPKFEYGGEVAMRAGSYDFYKPSADFYGPITQNLAFRLIGTYENAASFRNSVESERYYVNPSLLYKLDSKTDVLVQADFLNSDYTPDFGIGSLNNNKIPTAISRSSFFNTPWAYGKLKQTTASVNLNHQFNSFWKLNTIVSYQNYNRDYYSTERIQADSIGDWNRNLTRSKTNENYYTGQLNLNGNIKTGKIGHQLLIGADAERYMNGLNTYTVTNTDSTKKITTYYLDANNKDQVSKSYDKINILDPNKYAPRTDFLVMNPFNSVKTPTNRFGIFFQDLISISEKVKVLAGLRWSYQNVVSPKVTDALTGERLPYANATTVRTTTKGTSISDKNDKAFSPRLGFVYQPTNSTSLFSSYSNNFVPNTGTDINGANLPASLIDQYEIGVKNDFLKGRLSVNLTAYKIINNNFAQTAQFKADGKTLNSDTNIKELNGQTTSDGVELDVNGTIAKGLNFLAGYSYNYMRYTKTSGLKGSFIEGERLVSNPAHTANATLFYTFSNYSLNGLKVGISGFYTGERNGGYNNTVGYLNAKGLPENRLIPVSGFTTFDISLGYTYKRFTILGKLSNITNELNYYVHENYSVNPIAPRQFTTTITYKF